MSRLRTLIPGLASGFAAVFGAFVACAAPAEEISVSQWAEQHRYVGSETGSSETGRWRNTTAPYLVEPMDACQVENGVQSVTLTGGAQFGKSECPLNALFHTITTTPRMMCVVLPSINEVQAWSRGKWDANVDAEEAKHLRSHILHRKSRSSEGSTSTVKRFRGGRLELITAGSSKQLQMKTFAVAVFEEIAQYEDEVGEGGDPIAAVETRLTVWKELAKRIYVSTPGFVNRDGRSCRITAYYNASDMRRWHTPCPHCDVFSVLDFGTFTTFEGRPVFSCTDCGGVIEEAHRTAMNARGVWLPTWEHPETIDDENGVPVPNPARERNPAPPKHVKPDDIARWRARDNEGRDPGYHLWQGQSNMAAWSDIARKWAKVQAGEGGEPVAIEFAQKVLGVAYAAKVERPEDVKLHEARGVMYPKDGEVPPWASIVTGAIDVQHNRLEWAVYAWGRGGIGARIATGVIPNNPKTWETWSEDAFALVNRKFSGPAYKARLPDYWAVDSGGNATDNVYAFCRQFASRAQPVLAIKGSSKDKGDALPFTKGNMVPVYLNRQRIGTVQLWFVGTHGLKGTVYQGLAAGMMSAETKKFEPGSLHYPKSATLDQFKQLTAEHLVRTDPRKPAGEWVKPTGVANEQLDLAVYCMALAINAGMDSMDELAWAKRAASRMPDQVVQELTPLERIARGEEAEAEAEAEAPAPAAPVVDLTPPPAKAAGRRTMSEADRERIRALGRRNAGDA